MLRCTAMPIVCLLVLTGGNVVYARVPLQDTPDDRPKRWAVVVGVSDYKDTQIAALHYPSDDARLLADALLARSQSGYSSETVFVVNGRDQESPSRDRLRAILDTVRERIRPQDSLLVYVSSHGMEYEGKAYLLLGDARLESIGETAVPVTELFAWMSAAPSRARMLILDACHSGEANARFTGASMGNALHNALAEGAAGSFVLSSSTLGQVSYESDELRHGVFTYFLSEALRGAPGVDRDKDGQVSWDEAARYVDQKVRDWCRQMDANQQPWKLESSTPTPPVITSLVETPKASDAIPAVVRFSYRIDPGETTPFVLYGDVRIEGANCDRKKVSLVMVKETGSIVSRRQVVSCHDEFNIFAVKLNWRPSRVYLEPKLLTLEENGEEPVRVIEEQQQQVPPPRASVSNPARLK